MSNTYNDLEGLRIAIEIETRGLEFYRQAYEYVPGEKEKELFLILMNEEIVHEKGFKQIFNKIEEEKNALSDEYMFDPEVSRYLTVLAELHIFPLPEKAKKKISELKTDRAILELALQAEKDSVLFYDELANHAKFPEARKIFMQLKAEEQTHIVKIHKMMEAWT